MHCYSKLIVAAIGILARVTSLSDISGSKFAKDQPSASSQFRASHDNDAHNSLLLKAPHSKDGEERMLPRALSSAASEARFANENLDLIQNIITQIQRRKYVDENDKHEGYGKHYDKAILTRHVTALHLNHTQLYRIFLIIQKTNSILPR